MRAPAAIAVVVPARDEELLLPGCLNAIDAAIEALHEQHPGIRAKAFVALDACQDGSAEVVARRPDVSAVVLHAGSVGVARASAVRAAADWARTSVGEGIWLANTDADSVVPTHWLTTQVQLAAAGLDLVVGTVQPVPTDLSPDVLTAWRERHSTADGHEHVHGANLGFSLTAYEQVGGYAPLAVHEDVALATAIKHAGRRWIATGAIPVITSGRSVGRAPEGFATYLHDLGTAL